MVAVYGTVHRIRVDAWTVGSDLDGGDGNCFVEDQRRYFVIYDCCWSRAQRDVYPLIDQQPGYLMYDEVVQKC